MLSTQFMPPAGHRADGACRTQTGGKGVYTEVAGLDEIQCKQRCAAEMSCLAIEALVYSTTHGHVVRVCELHTLLPTRVAPLPNVRCLVKQQNGPLAGSVQKQKQPQVTLPPSLPIDLIISTINKRYRDGRPTNNLAEAGVLTHQLDFLTRRDYHSQTEPWMPCAPHSACGIWSDRISASLSNRRLPFLFSATQAGFVIDPNGLDLLCAFPMDGATLDRKCEPLGKPGCVPGCIGTTGPAWDGHYAKFPNHYNGPYDSNHLVNMMQRHEQTGGNEGYHCLQQPPSDCRYNELVFSASSWSASLPRHVMAVFYPYRASQQERQFARDLHRRFTEHFRIGPSSFPILMLDRRNQYQPFSLAV